MDRPQAVIPALIALGGVLLGFVLGAVSCGSGSGTSAPPIAAALSPPGEDPNLAALLDAVHALGDRIVEATKTRQAAAVPGETSTRTPVEGTGMVTATELTDLLGRCTGLIERLERRTRGEERRDLSLVTQSATRERFQEYDREVDDAEDRFTSDHLLWSYQQVLDRYGSPDSIHARENGTVYWRYGLVLSNGEEETCSFYFTDGLVMRGNL